MTQSTPATQRTPPRRIAKWLVTCAVVVLLAQQIVANLAARQSTSSLEFHRLEQAQFWLNLWEISSWKSVDLCLQRARLQRLKGQSETARAELDLARKLGAAEADLRAEEILMLAQGGQLSRVEQHLKSLLIEQRVGLQSVCEAYINGFLLNYRFGDAAGLLDVWEKDFPEAAQPKFVRGLIEEQLGNSAIALESFQAALKLDPSRNDIRLRLAIALTRQHNYKQAVEYFKKIEAQYANSEEFLLHFATCLSEMGDQKAALPVLNRLLDQHPQHREANLLKARHHFANQEYAEAKALLEQRLRQTERDYDYRYLMGLVLRAQGHTSEAASHMTFVEKADAAMAKVRLAMDQTRDKPRRADTRFEIGSQLLELGFRNDGASWLRSVLEVDPAHLGAHQALEKHYREEGQDSLAQRHHLAIQRIEAQAM